MSTQVHPSAIIHKGAELGNDVTIGPYAIIGPKVRIGDRSEIGSHAVIEGRTTIGSNNRISAFTSVGSRPQDLKYKGEDSELIIGNNNQIREYSNISLGTEGGGMKTVIGSNNLIMVFTHVGHDCLIGSNCIIVNGVALGGHVIIDDQAVLGGLSAVHQFCRIGKMAMIAGGAMVNQDVTPYTMVHGDRAKPNGLNVVGIRRAGFSTEMLSSLKTMYRLTYNENLTVQDAISRIEAEIEASPLRQEFVAFLKASERGLCR